MASDSGAKAESKGQDVFHRLVRSLSGRNGSSKRSLPTEDQARPTSPTTTPSSPPAEPLQRVASSSSSIAKAKTKIADRLKQLGKDMGKLRKGSSSGKPNPASPVVKVPPAAGPSGHAKLLSMVAELDEPDGDTTPANPDDPPSATTLAKQIQALIDALPFPAPSPTVIKNPKIPPWDKDGRPVTPPDPTPVDDPRLVAFLSDPTVMNGSSEEGRPSIWRVLEVLGVPPHGFPPTGDDEVEGGGDDTVDEGGQTVITDTTSVMVYAPLIPSAEDLVELAERVKMQVGAEAAGGDKAPGTSWTTVWPLSVFYQRASQSQLTAPPEFKRRLSLDVLLPPRRSSVDSSKRKVRVQSVKAWVPSTTKLSIQATWWGYRLYLPPPVLAELGDETLEATKRAALITTALTWFFNNLPIDSLPLAVQPAALLLQRLVPYLGYIGPFISWSWGEIKGYDIGYGVILTATWLLPVALIPGTWGPNDFPQPPTQPAPVPPAQQPSQPAPSVPSTSPPPISPSVPTTTPGQGDPPVPPPPQAPQPAPSNPPTSIPSSPSIPSTAPDPSSPTQVNT